MTTSKKEIFELSTDNFEDGWKIILDSNLEIKEMFKNTNTKLEVQKRMITLISLNIPDIDNYKNIFWNLILQSNRCMLKTDKKVSVGWYINEDSNHKTVYTFQVILYNANMIYQRAMLEKAGLVEVKQS